MREKIVNEGINQISGSKYQIELIMPFKCQHEVRADATLIVSGS